jgi:hypothetical protein
VTVLEGIQRLRHVLTARVRPPSRRIVERTLILLMVAALVVVAFLVLSNWHAVNVYNNIIGGNGE